jgi:arginine decarboxylase
MIGLVPLARFRQQHIKDLIDRSPFAAAAVSRQPTYAVVTNSTYDGFCYDVVRVVEELAQSVPRIHFDEAWYAYAKFHPLYRGRFGMDVPKDMPDRPLIFAVQSTHKMLAAFSMASMIHVKLSPRAPLEFDQFNESFMMHGTTSPFYPMIASIDVATAMMDEPAGQTLMTETIQDAINFRKAMASVAHRLRSAEEGSNGWFFGMFQPDYVKDPSSEEVFRFEDAPDSLLSQAASCWALKPGEDWHGFNDADIADDYCLLDPTKVTILTPGIGPNGHLAESGIPAAILTAFLDSRRVEIARTGDYTILALFSVGTSKGKWGSLLETLFEFKRLYDHETPLAEALPHLPSKFPDRYGALTLKGLSDEMHEAMKGLRLPALLQEACDVEPDPVMTPAATYQKLVREGTERIKLTEAMGRIAAVMLVPYPPGIPIRMPGERMGDANSPTIRFLLALEEFSKRFPGFEREVHGVEVDSQGEFWVRCVIESPTSAGPRAKPRTRPSSRASKKRT